MACFVILAVKRDKVMAKRDKKEEMESYKRAVLAVCEKNGYDIKPKTLNMEWGHDQDSDPILRVFVVLKFDEKPLSADQTLQITFDVREAIEDIWEYNDSDDVRAHVRLGFEEGQQFKRLKKIA